MIFSLNRANIQHTKGGKMMKQNSKTFKTKANAKKFADKLQEDGQLNVQIWELPASNNKNVFVVIRTEI